MDGSWLRLGLLVCLRVHLMCFVQCQGYIYVFIVSLLDLGTADDKNSVCYMLGRTLELFQNF